VCGDAAAGKFELYQPFPRVLAIRRRKLPFLGSFRRMARKIPARTPDFQVLGNHISRSIDGHTNRYLDLAMDRFARTDRDGWNLFVQHRRSCGRGYRGGLRRRRGRLLRSRLICN